MGDLPHHAWFLFIARHISPSSKPIADLFSGPGYVAAAARAEGLSCIPVDKHLPFLKKSTSGVCADASHLPFGDASFSALAATNAALNYLGDTAALMQHLSECYRVLCDGGVYVFDVCPYERAVMLTTHMFDAVEGKVRFAHRYESHSKLLTTTVTMAGEAPGVEQHLQRIFTREELTGAAVTAGFTVKEVTPNYGLPVTGENFPVMTYVLCKGEAVAPRK
jgi:SAM-dependent methyltransferase